MSALASELPAKPDDEVLVARSDKARKFYHKSDDCQHVNDDDRFRPVAIDLVAAIYQPCLGCYGANPTSSEYDTFECPACGQWVKRLPSHLPECAKGEVTP